MQQLGSVQGYLSDHSGSSQYHAAHASRERNEFSRAGQEYFVHPMERPQFDGRSHFDGRLGAESRGRPAAGLEFSSRGSEHSLSQALSSRSPARTEDGLSGSIIAVGRRLREEMSVIGHDQKQLQDNILFEIDRIAARMSEQVLPCAQQSTRNRSQRAFQEAVLRDLQDELRRLLELHGVENVTQKQHLHPETVFTASSHVMQQQSRGQFQDPPPQIQQAPPNFQASNRTYTQAGPELAAYTQSWPSSSVVGAGMGMGIPVNNFRRTLDEAHM